MPRHDVFISYSSKDKLTADKICAFLEANGIRCWMTPRDVLPGSNWGESIIDAINGAKVMLLVFSANSNASNHIKREVERTVNRGNPVIPVRIEDVMPTKSLEYFISSQHWLDAYPPPLEKHLDHLAMTLKMLLSKIGGEPEVSKPAPRSITKHDFHPSPPVSPQIPLPREETAIPSPKAPAPKATTSILAGKNKWIAALVLSSLVVGVGLAVGLLGRRADQPSGPAPVAVPPPAVATPAVPKVVTADDYVKKGVEAKDIEQKFMFFAKALELNADHISALTNRAALYYGKGEYDQALIDYDKLISLKTNDAELYNSRGNVYLAKGNYDQAISDFNKAASLDANLPKTFMNRGNAYYYKKDYELAIKDFSTAISLKPDSVIAYNNRGKTYSVKGHYEPALNDFNKAISLDPLYGKAYKNRGAVYLEQGQDDLAIADFDKAISLKIDLAESYLCRGKLYKKKGEDKLATEDLNKAKELNPNLSF
ncbi:MAG: toll/interleukin-1 receptor domain-containing protein [Planctomycetes bacterium]|nr:toll/interleukin-1 receptor domain-containing protein [Planctomycetota bacterium]MCG2771387.1 toll/interleukin-1 receptor domain-containing protein [Desulfobacterales bacterium]